jgi:hypothetical protein
LTTPPFVMADFYRQEAVTREAARACSRSHAGALVMSVRESEQTDVSTSTE